MNIHELEMLCIYQRKIDNSNESEKVFHFFFNQIISNSTSKIKVTNERYFEVKLGGKMIR